jgi:hypothetical protein
MGWNYETEDGNDFHEGYLFPEFSDGERGSGSSGGGIPHDAIAVELRHDGTYRTRPAGEVIGWRVCCDCSQTNRPGYDVWVSKQLWVRVPSKALEDPTAHKLYAVDEDVVDIAERADVANAAWAAWRAEHIDAIDAGAAIHDAVSAQRAADAQLGAAVEAARRKGLSWAKIGAAAGVSAQAAHERWASKTGASHS